MRIAIPSVVILVIDGVSVFTDEREGNPPVAAYRYSPRAPAVTSERMKVQPRVQTGLIGNKTYREDG